MTRQDKWINDPHEGVVKDQSWKDNVEKEVFKRLADAKKAPDDLLWFNNEEKQRYVDFLAGMSK